MVAEPGQGVVVVPVCSAAHRSRNRKHLKTGRGGAWGRATSAPNNLGVAAGSGLSTTLWANKCTSPRAGSCCEYEYSVFARAVWGHGTECKMKNENE